MTTPRKDGTIYLWLMGIQITIMLAFIAFIGSFIMNQYKYIEQNTIEHANIYKEMTKDSAWTRWTYRYQVIPAYELSRENLLNIEQIQANLNSIDSNLVVQGYNIKRIFLYLRNDRDGSKAFND